MAYDSEGNYAADIAGVDEKKWHKETAWNRTLQLWLDNLEIAKQEIQELTKKKQKDVKSSDIFRIRSYFSMVNMMTYIIAKLIKKEEEEFQKGQPEDLSSSDVEFP